jgi:pyruvate formate lyase activating enzyme
MALEIKGFIPVTMLDWKGKLASMIFLPGCNFRCPFCQNPDLVVDYDKLPTYPKEAVFSHLLNRRGWLDGVVVGGGEPTIHPELTSLLKEIKKIGYPVKLDTNGSNPEILDALIQQKLVAAVAMDIKTSFDKYALTVKKPAKTEKILRSIELLIDSELEYEFRTTVVPGYVEKDDILKIAQQIAGARLYVLQQFNPKTVLAPEARKIKPFSASKIKDLAEKCGGFVTTEVRGI